jgi:hypothetical protein
MVFGLVLPHARKDKHNMAFWRKRMFWRRRDVAADIQEHIEESVKKLEELDASVAIPEEKLKKWNRKSEVEEKLHVSEEVEVEATLRGQIRKWRRWAQMLKTSRNLRSCKDQTPKGTPWKLLSVAILKISATGTVTRSTPVYVARRRTCRKEMLTRNIWKPHSVAKFRN